MRTLLCLVFLMPAYVYGFAETYYVRDDGGSYGLEDGSNWANAFKGWSDIAFGPGANQVGPGDLLCVDGIVGSLSDSSISVGGTSAIVPLTLAGSGFTSCNDPSDIGSGTIKKEQISGTAVLSVTSGADYVIVRDVTIQGAGSGSVGADGISIGTRGVAQTGIQIGPNVIIKSISDDGLALNANTLGGVEIDCDPVFGQISATGCEYSVKIDTTRNDGISCRTPGVTAVKWQIHNSGRNTSGNNDGLALYDDGATGSDCWAFIGKFFWISNHGGATVAAGSSAIDHQVTGTVPVGLEQIGRASCRERV